MVNIECSQEGSAANASNAQLAQGDAGHAALGAQGTILDCPFASLGMGEADIDRYLSDANERLNGESWKLNTTKQMESMVLANQDPDFIADYDAIQAKTQEAMEYRIVAFRNKLRRFVVTLVECIHFGHTGREDFAADCFDDLQKLDSEIGKLYAENKTSLCSVIKEFHAAVKRHEEAKASLKSLHENGSAVSTGTLAGSLLSSILVFVGWLNPASLSTIDMTNRWFRPVRMDGKGNVFYEEGPGTVKLNTKHMFPMAGIGLFGLVVWQALRGYMSRRARQAESEEKRAKMNALQLKFVRQNETMWEGMIMWVEDTQQSIQVLKTLKPERVAMRKAQLHDIGQKLFGMSMAVDEYIFWLNKHGYFPENYSIRNWITPARYDRIKSIIDKPATEITA